MSSYRLIGWNHSNVLGRINKRDFWLNNCLKKFNSFFSSALPSKPWKFQCDSYCFILFYFNVWLGLTSLTFLLKPHIGSCCVPFMKTTTGADEIIFSIRTFIASGIVDDDDDEAEKAYAPDVRDAICPMILVKLNICN